MAKCKCWDNEHTWDNGIPTCLGTKEREPCYCGGCRRKCDFYEEIREEAMKNYIQSIPRGNINRKTLVRKLLEVSDSTGEKLPNWVFSIIYSLHREN